MHFTVVRMPTLWANKYSVSHHTDESFAQKVFLSVEEVSATD